MKRICQHCGEEVLWSFPRPEDFCPECGRQIGVAKAPEPPTDDPSKCSVCGRDLLFHNEGTEGGIKRVPYCPVHSTRGTAHLRT